MHTMCQGKLLRSCTLAHKVYKSLMSEGFRGVVLDLSTFINYTDKFSEPAR